MFLLNSAGSIDLGKKQNADGFEPKTSPYFPAT